MHYIIEDEPLGTLNAIRLGMEAIEDEECQFVIRNGDIVSDFNLKRMIELSWKQNKFEEGVDVLSYITNILAWLMETIAAEKGEHGVKITGYVVICDEFSFYHTLLMCKEEGQKRVLEILQQPPEEYKEKYVACILCEEPNPVQEITEYNKKEEDGEITIHGEDT